MKRYKLMELRRSKGLSGEEMARRIGISYSLYRKIEDGNRDGSFKTLRKICEELNTTDITIFY